MNARKESRNTGPVRRRKMMGIEMSSPIVIPRMVRIRRRVARMS